ANAFPTVSICLCFATLLFTAVHVAFWDHLFPTTTEKVLWQVSSLILFGVTVAFWILETAASWIRLGRWKWIYLWLTDRSGLPEFERRDEKLKDQVAREPTTLPLACEFWTIGSVAFLYSVARMYKVVESFLELRDLDPTAYMNVNWAMYIPHV
ncbi:hypothetical protein N658DRAFT_432881, partial [Parathielavia hyrcaniae]